MALVADTRILGAILVVLTVDASDIRAIQRRKLLFVAQDALIELGIQHVLRVRVEHILQPVHSFEALDSFVRATGIRARIRLLPTFHDLDKSEVRLCELGVPMRRMLPQDPSYERTLLHVEVGVVGLSQRLEVFPCDDFFSDVRD